MTNRRMTCLPVTPWRALAAVWATGYDESDVGYGTGSSTVSSPFWKRSAARPLAERGSQPVSASRGPCVLAWHPAPEQPVLVPRHQGHGAVSSKGPDGSCVDLSPLHLYLLHVLCFELPSADTRGSAHMYVFRIIVFLS